MHISQAQQSAVLGLSDLFGFTHLAMAGPLLAPYDLTAQQSLKKMKLWQAIQPKRIFGKSLNFTYQFIASENAELGFVAKSQVFSQGGYKQGSVWPVASDYYKAILRAAVILKPSINKPQVQSFLKYLQSQRAQAIIKSYGYQ